METPPTVPTAAARPLPDWVRYAIAAAILLGLVLVLNWAAGQRAESIRQETFARGVDALAAASIPVMLQNNRPAIRRHAESIAAAAGYRRVTITDAQGRVLGTTDRTLDNAEVADLRLSPPQARVRRQGGLLQADRAILLGDNNRLGSIRVEMRP